MQGAFSKLSSFWISFATDDPTRLGSRNYPNLEILRRGLEKIRVSGDPTELSLIESEIKRTEQAHVYRDSRYWRDLRRFRVGIQMDMSKREMVFYKKHQVYPDGESGREISPEEIRAKQWYEKDQLNQKLARLAELERELTSGSNSTGNNSRNQTSGSKKSASSFDDLPDSLDEPTLGIETAPMDEMKKPLVESICIGGPTAEIKPDPKPKKRFQIHHDPTLEVSTQGMSQKIEKLPTFNLEESIDIAPSKPNKPKLQVYTDPTADIMGGHGQDMSKKVDLSTLNLAPDVQSISQALSCSLDLGKENIPEEGQTFAFLSPKPNEKIEKFDESNATRSIKRGTEVLTPQRNQPTLKKTDRRAADEATPTYIVKNANDMIDNFFNETNVFFKHKPKPEMDTLRLSPTTTPQVTREKKNTTARLFMSPDGDQDVNDHQGVKKFDIFNDFSASSRRTSQGSISSLSHASLGKSGQRCPSETLDLIASPDEMKQTESTRRYAGGFRSAAIPDISIFGDETSTWQKTAGTHDESSVYGAPKEVNPWSQTFVQMQIGQSRKCIPTEGVLLEKQTVYKFQGMDLKSNFAF